MSELLNAKDAGRRIGLSARTMTPGQILLRALFNKRFGMPLGDITEFDIECAQVSWEIDRDQDRKRNVEAKARERYAQLLKSRQRARQAKREAEKARRTPAWADLKAIEVFYVKAREMTAQTGIEHEVDHIIPLRGRLVSGLHVHNNLQILTGTENARKCNRFEVE